MTTTTTTTPEEGRRPERPRVRVSAMTHVQDLIRRDPALVETWDPVVLRDELLLGAVPPSVLEDLWGFWLRFNREHLDPSFVSTKRAIGKPRQSDPADKAEREAKLARIVEQQKGKTISRLLDQVMLNGKTLGACTKDDLKTESGWLGLVARRLKKGQVVKDVFDADALAASYARYTKAAGKT